MAHVRFRRVDSHNPVGARIVTMRKRSTTYMVTIATVILRWPHGATLENRTTAKDKS